MTDALDFVSEGLAEVEPAPSRLAPVDWPADPWERRRMHGFGGSEIASLLIALRRHSDAGVAEYVVEKARPVSRGKLVGVRLFMEKARVKRPTAVSEVARIGARREEELREAWRATLGSGDIIDPDTVSGPPKRHYLPLVDRVERRLAVTPDGDCEDVFGRVMTLELKCAWKVRAELPWEWAVQCQAEMAVSDTAGALLVCGQEWSRYPDRAGRIDVWRVDRDERAIAEIREACAEGWAEVEKLKGAIGS